MAPDTKALRIGGATGALLAIALGFFGGFLGSLAVLAAIAGVGRFLQSKSVAYRCTACNKTLASAWVKPLERDAIPDASSWLRIQAAGFGFLSLLVAIAFVLFLSGGFSSTTEETIQKLRAEREVDKLSAIVSKNDDYNLMFSASKALATLGPSGTEALTKLAQHKESRVKRYACIGLQNVGPDAIGALPTVMEVAEKESDMDARSAAIHAIGAMGPAASPAIPLLEQISKERTIDATAKDALRKVRPKP